MKLWDLPLDRLIREWNGIDEGFTNLAAIRYLCLNDRFYLLVRACSRQDALHPWLLARCREVERNPDGHLDLWAREHYKSTIITFAGSIQEILKDPEITIAIFSHTRPIARKFWGQIKQELESNAVLKRVFPDILFQRPEKESTRWSEEKGICVNRKGNIREATLEAWGLVDGQPTGAHFRLMIYDDVMTQESVNTPDQIAKTTAAWELSDNLGMAGGRKWHIGTRYCNIGSNRVLMADWSHKPIQDVQIGDEIIGWELRDGKRWLRISRVLNRGSHSAQPVRRFGFANGRDVVCTADHRWWRGPSGSGDEYKPLGLHYHKMGHVRQLMVPADRDDGRDASWLAGFFDGEGTIKQNQYHPSGVISVCQSVKNKIVMDRAREALTALGFTWTDRLVETQESWSDRTDLYIGGGWRDRYRFLRQVAPTRKAKLVETLFGQLQTEHITLVSDDDAGVADVYWLETQTGNYVVEGFCSSNSFADTYQAILDRKSVIPRIYPATADGTADGDPVFFPPVVWEQKKRDQGPATIACHCAGTQVLMADWSYKNIEDVSVGESVVGFYFGTGKGQKATLVPTKVLAVSDRRSEANIYHLESGATVSCTPDHLWWTKRRGDAHRTYAPLGAQGYHDLHELALISHCQFHKLNSWQDEKRWQWLAGLFDGEGSLSGGMMTITQSRAHNPQVCDRIEETLAALGIKYSTYDREAHSTHGKHSKGSTIYLLRGGRHTRHKMLLHGNPARNKKIIERMYCQLGGKSEALTDKVVRFESLGEQRVFNIQTETGNYVAGGYASKNCQMLQNPIAGQQALFRVEWLQIFEVRPETINVYIMVDPARSNKKDSAKTAMAVIGVDYARNKYLVDGLNHRMDLKERWEGMRSLYRRWLNQPGVQIVQVGYESFGAQADLDYFHERMDVEGVVFPIEELAWPREGLGSKVDRVQRLIPDFRNGRFFIPYDTDDRRLTSSQKRVQMEGSPYRIARPIQQKDAQGNLYDLKKDFIEQVHYFPFGGLKDLIDATSRLYDMDVQAPLVMEESDLEPAATAD